MQKIALKTASAVFFIVGALHVWRLVTKTDVMWGSTLIAPSWSVLGLIVAFSLSALMCYAAKK